MDTYGYDIYIWIWMYMIHDMMNGISTEEGWMMRYINIFLMIIHN